MALLATFLIFISFLINFFGYIYLVVVIDITFWTIKNVRRGCKTGQQLAPLECELAG